MTFAEPDGATPRDPDEKQGLKFGHITTRRQLDQLEQANIEQGLLWVPRRRSGDILDDAFIRTLHKRLFGDVWRWAGEYRRTEKNIGIDPYQISTQLRILLDDMRYWSQHDVFSPLEAAARFHSSRRANCVENRYQITINTPTRWDMHYIKTNNPAKWVVVLHN